MSNVVTHLPLRLFGLPGCGVSRLQRAWQSSLPNALQDVPFSAIHATSAAEPGFNLLVLDARSMPQLPRDQWLLAVLNTLLSQADAVLLNFLEAASLEQQLYWKNHLRGSAQPLLMSVQQAIPERLPALLTQAQGRAFPQITLSAPLQEWEFELPKVNLEQLMMVLDNAKSALGAKLLRAKGVLHTQEYSNLVMLEGSPYRWDCFAAQSDEVDIWQNRLWVQGIELDKGWFEAMLPACLS
ncbi:hypothetical protein THMIRHAS_19070 [Thiosulfatimonas sediminis]|uniref:CobW C-terminal domain-containing protein n=1 Tax=Thiosulfatimonas sediminis TaxID=2675054 RepID=A0A6F8PX04_9GAMM|nr:GTP-binding protein [Thiosulfatimonas sediminis]BBP46534.1 hypothetical protein THMIRHAS_19070 [Thiosulfatimonas sediminis]